MAAPFKIEWRWPPPIYRSPQCADGSTSPGHAPHVRGARAARVREEDVCDDLDGDIAAPVVSGSHKILALLFSPSRRGGSLEPASIEWSLRRRVCLYLLHRLHDLVNGIRGDPSSVVHAGLDGFPEVNADVDPRRRVLVRGLREARVRADHRRCVRARPAGTDRHAARRERHIVGAEHLFQDLCCHAALHRVPRIMIGDRVRWLQGCPGQVALGRWDCRPDRPHGSP